MERTSDFGRQTSDLGPRQRNSPPMRGVMLSLRSIWREAGLVPEQQLGGTRQILRGLKATQDDARSPRSEVRGPKSEVRRPPYLLNLCSFHGSPYMW